MFVSFFAWFIWRQGSHFPKCIIFQTGRKKEVMLEYRGAQSKENDLSRGLTDSLIAIENLCGCLKRNSELNKLPYWNYFSKYVKKKRVSSTCIFPELSSLLTYSQDYTLKDIYFVKPCCYSAVSFGFTASDSLKNKRSLYVALCSGSFSCCRMIPVSAAISLVLVHFWKCLLIWMNVCLSM